MSIKKSYSSCLELLGQFDKRAHTDETGWKGLMPTDLAAPVEMSADPQPTPEPPDIDNDDPGG